MELNDYTLQVIRAAYDGTPETVFVTVLGRMVADHACDPRRQSFAEYLVEALTHPALPDYVPVVQKQRFRVLQGVFLSSYLRFSGHLPEPPPETQH